MFAFPRRYDSYEEYQHERLKREEHRRDYERRESERAEQREKQRQKAIVSPTGGAARLFLRHLPALIGAPAQPWNFSLSGLPPALNASALVQLGGTYRQEHRFPAPLSAGLAVKKSRRVGNRSSADADSGARGGGVLKLAPLSSLMLTHVIYCSLFR